jgi:hypothetical protein
LGTFASRARFRAACAIKSTRSISDVGGSAARSVCSPMFEKNEELTRTYIEVALEPIETSVLKLEADTQSQFAAMRDELKAIHDRAV